MAEQPLQREHRDRPVQPVHGLILAGGQSSRMGTDKALLPVGGKPLIYRLASQLSSFAQSLTVSIGTPEREAIYRESLGEFAPQTKFVADHIPGCGPLSGLHAGLTAIGDGFAFVMACDMPQLSLPLVQRLMDTLEGGANTEADVICAEGQPFHALYHTSAAAEILRSLEAGDYRLMGLLSRLRTIAIEPPDGEWSSVFANLNTPEDYKKYVAEKS